MNKLIDIANDPSNTNADILEAIRERGFKTKINHNILLDGKGGHTDVFLIKSGEPLLQDNPEATKSAIAISGRSICSTKDFYAKKVGLRLALKRAAQRFSDTFEWL